jgi:hypothetical protein
MQQLNVSLFFYITVSVTRKNEEIFNCIAKQYIFVRYNTLSGDIVRTEHQK